MGQEKIECNMNSFLFVVTSFGIVTITLMAIIIIVFFFIDRKNDKDDKK